MSTIIAGAYSGATDLYHGVPDLLNGKIIDIEYDTVNTEDCRTTLVVENARGDIHKIIISRSRL